MAKDERKRRRRKKNNKGGFGGAKQGGGDGRQQGQQQHETPTTSATTTTRPEDDDDDEQEEEEEDEEGGEHKSSNKLKLVLKLPRSYLHSDSSLQHNSSSSSRALATRGGGGGRGLSDTLSSPTPRRRSDDPLPQQEATVTVTAGVAHSHKQAALLPPAESASESAVSSYGASEDGEKSPKKRRLNAVAEPSANGSALLLPGPSAGAANGALQPGSAVNNNIKAGKRSQSLELTEPVPGTPSDPQSGTHLPEKKVLESILDKLQKKDTYGVFSEPVDPKELPDYHDIIQHPMDFGTIRKKLTRGVYANLEQFEKDVFLICTNAMRYNASDTIYYRQARSIQELARKNFQNLRLDPEEIEVDLKPASKTKSSYSSKKWTKKPGFGRSLFEPTGSDFSSGATLATGGDHANWSNASLHDTTKIRKAATSERPANAFGHLDITGRSLHGHRSADGNVPLAEMKTERSDELSASLLKAPALKNGRRPLLWEENRRGTYKPSNQQEIRNESIFPGLDVDSKQLVPTGIRVEYAYARSLACFAANLGPVAWRIAAQKIERALPSGVPFGPGWVGEYEAPSRVQLSCESKSPAVSVPLVTMPIVLGENKLKLNNNVDAQVIRDEGITKNLNLGGQSGMLPTAAASANKSVLNSSIYQSPEKMLAKNLILEDRSGPLTTAATSINKSVSNPSMYQLSENRSSIRITQSDGNVYAGLSSTGDAKVNLPSHVLKQGQMKPASPVAKSNDLGLTGAKFVSEATQSRLLEMVSRNNTLLQGTSFKQADGSQPVTSVQGTHSGNISTINDVAGVVREVSNSSKRLSSSASINVAHPAGNSSLRNYQIGSAAIQPSQSTSSQDHGVLESNCVPNLLPGKAPALQQRCSSMSANTSVFGHSSIPSTGTSMRRENAAVQGWMRSRSADLADADASSRQKIQNTPNSHFAREQLQSQSREFSAVSRFMQQEMPLDMSQQALLQRSRLHPQNSAKLSHPTVVSGPMVESQVPNRMASFSHVQTPVGVESSKPQVRSWRGLPSQHVSQQTSDLSPLIPPDLNVGFQNPKSPARQSSGMLADSQQPDLALQL